MNKTIIISLALVAVLGLVFIGKKGQWDGELQMDSSDGLAAFTSAELGKTTRINIVKGKEKPVVLEKKDGQWVVASAYGYKADPKVADEILASAGKISGGEQVAELAGSHKNFEVDDIRGSFNHTSSHNKFSCLACFLISSIKRYIICNRTTF